MYVTIQTLNSKLKKSIQKHTSSDNQRPYEHLSDENVKDGYVMVVGIVRDADDVGLHLSPYIDIGMELAKEWRYRGNDKEELNKALADAGYEPRN